MSLSAVEPLIGITGGTGALGRRLVRRLLEKKRRLALLCRDPEMARRHFGDSPRYVRGDITRPETMGDFVNGLGVCVHLAAQVDAATRADYERVNVRGTADLCAAILQRSPTCRLVHCSSIAVLRLDQMQTDYSLSKKEAEAAVRAAMENRGLRASIIYSGLIYGPEDHRFLPAIARQARKGRMFLVSGGERCAPLIYIEDLCDLFCKVIDSPRAEGRSYLGIQQSERGMHDFIRCVAQYSGGKVLPLVVPRFLLYGLARGCEGLYALFRASKPPALSRRAVDVLTLSYLAKSFDEEARLGWRPATTFEQGIRLALGELSQ